MEVLNKFTVLACYCIYFTKSKQEYSRMFSNVIRGFHTNFSFKIVSSAAAVALELMQPDWEYKESKDKPISQRKLKGLRKELREAEGNYKNAETAGAQHLMKSLKEKIERLRHKIELAKIGKYGEKKEH